MRNRTPMRRFAHAPGRSHLRGPRQMNCGGKRIPAWCPQSKIQDLSLGHDEAFDPTVVPRRLCRHWRGAGVRRAAADAQRARTGGGAAVRCGRYRRGRRRRRRDRGRPAALRLARVEIRGAGSRRRARRPLHHRQPDVRDSVRSWRPLDPCRRHQSAGPAGRPIGIGNLSGAARTALANWTALCPRRRARGLPRDARPHQQRHRDRGPRPGRCPGRQGAAEGPWRMATHGRVRGGTVHLRQGPS